MAPSGKRREGEREHRGVPLDSLSGAGWACSRQRPSCQPLESTWHSFLPPEIKCSTQGKTKEEKKREVDAALLGKKRP